MIKMPLAMAVPAQKFALVKFCVHFREVLGLARALGLSSAVWLVLFIPHYRMMKFQ